MKLISIFFALSSLCIFQIPSAYARYDFVAYNARPEIYQKNIWIEFPDFKIRFIGKHSMYSDTKHTMVDYYAFEVNDGTARTEVQDWNIANRCTRFSVGNVTYRLKRVSVPKGNDLETGQFSIIKTAYVTKANDSKSECLMPPLYDDTVPFALGAWIHFEDFSIRYAGERVAGSTTLPERFQQFDVKTQHATQSIEFTPTGDFNPTKFTVGEKLFYLTLEPISAPSEFSDPRFARLKPEDYRLKILTESAYKAEM